MALSTGEKNKELNYRLKIFLVEKQKEKKNGERESQNKERFYKNFFLESIYSFIRPCHVKIYTSRKRSSLTKVS
jgi:hypothetical protein